jgi:hypothetical protein
MAISKDLWEAAQKRAIEGMEAQEEIKVEESDLKPVKGNKGPTLHYRGHGYGSQGEPDKDMEI